RKGTIAGCINPTDGYWRIKIKGRNYYAHKLAWFYVTAKFPTFHLDHKNTIKCDNRFENLRPASRSLNGANRRKPRNNTSGFKGVSTWPSGRWFARIRYSGKLHHLGTFDDPAVAHVVYVEAAKRLFGEFARV